MFKKWHKWVLKTFWGVKWLEHPLCCLKKPPFGCRQPPQRNWGSEKFTNLTSLLSSHNPSWDEKDTPQHEKPSTSMGQHHLLEKRKNSGYPIAQEFNPTVSHIQGLLFKSYIKACCCSNCAFSAEQESLLTGITRKHNLHCTSKLLLGYSFVCPNHLAARTSLWGQKCCERLISKKHCRICSICTSTDCLCVWSPLW